MRGLRLVLVAAAAGLVLADASVVTLALVDLEQALATSVTGVASVLFVYTAVLAVALAVLSRHPVGGSPAALAVPGFLLACVASVLCAVAGSLPLLLVGRSLQALGGAAALVGAFALMDGDGIGRRAWLAVSVLGAALGPALGGVLTEAVGWRAIFAIQVPIAAAGAGAAIGHGWRRRAVPAAAPSAPARAACPPAAHAEPNRRAQLALALLSAALSAVLFLLVLLVVAGWSVSPLRAAVAVSALPLAAVVGARIRGAPAPRAATGCALVAAGVLALAWLPQARLLWTLLPQGLAGLGMGMALTALGGELLEERTPGQAARSLAVRQAGIALVLAGLAPLIAHQLDGATRTAKLRGIAIVLDARLPPQRKLALAPALLSAGDRGQPRARLRAAVAAQRSGFSGSDLIEYDQVAARADDVLLEAVGAAFHDAILIAGGLALLAAVVLVAGGGPPSRRGRGRRPMTGVAVAGALAATAAVPIAYALAERSLRPTPVVIGDPCRTRALPNAGGLGGLLQDSALQLLDTTACRLHATREELVLALADDREARTFAARHGGVDPRSAGGLLGALLGG